MADIKDRLKADLAAALRAKDEPAKTTIRMLMAAITTEEIAGTEPRALSTDEELSVLTREMRKRRDSAETYAGAGRMDLADRENAEAEFIATYLPAPLTSAELEALVGEAIESVRATGETPSMKHMGTVVRSVNEQARGRADGAEVARVVRQHLQQG